MPPSFIPTSNPAAGDRSVANDGWYPDLSVAEFRLHTGMGEVFSTDRVAVEILAAVIEINAGIAAWRVGQTAPSLADVPAGRYGGTSEKVALYTRAVYTLARARLVDVVRDYDSTGKGHDRADALDPTVAAWRQASQEAVARLIGRNRTTVELI